MRIYFCRRRVLICAFIVFIFVGVVYFTVEDEALTDVHTDGVEKELQSVDVRARQVTKSLLLLENTQWNSSRREVPAIILAASDFSTYEKSSNCPNTTLQECSFSERLLIGHIPAAVLLLDSLTFEDVLNIQQEQPLMAGGRWFPPDCKPSQRIAIIIPYRDRSSHLHRLLAYLTPVLQRQRLHFFYVVAEQYGSGVFNKGRIMNAAFEVATDVLDADCVIFHDVDMFPQNDRIQYRCRDQPVHMGAYVDSLGYELWYNYLVGGVLAIRPQHFRHVNGFSNLYWAWGGEDDDLGHRLLGAKLTIHRPPHDERSYYTMVRHTKRHQAAPSLIRALLQTAVERAPHDGLAQHLWRVKAVRQTQLYYHMYIDVGAPPGEWSKGRAERNREQMIQQAALPSLFDLGPDGSFESGDLLAHGLTHM